MSHSTGTPDQIPDTDPRMFPALRVLERQTPPLKYGRAPYWRAPVTPPSRDAYTPSWNWQSPHEFEDGLRVAVLDVNAAYLAAIGSARIAHSHLTNRGPIHHFPDPRDVAPGYYRITVPNWSFSGTIVHPLGDTARVQAEDTLWIAGPTLVLLLELSEAGHLGYFEILDAWTADVACELRSWAERLRSLRGECMDRIELAQTEMRRRHEVARYDALKTGYSAALSMMLDGSKCLTRRPDWAHTIYAQHAAATWRKAWRWTFTGHPLVAMGAVDEIAVLQSDLKPGIDRPRPPFRYDPSGRQPGALKPKTTYLTGVQTQRAESVHLVDEADEIL